MAIMNNVTMNTHVKVFVRICFQFPWMHRNKISGNSMFNFEKLPNCFPKLPYHSTFLPIVYVDSNFLRSSPALVTVCLIDYSYPSGCEADLIVVYDLHLHNE